MTEPSWKQPNGLLPHAKELAPADLSQFAIRQSNLRKDRLNSCHQLIEILRRRPPDGQVVHFRIPVDQNVSHSNHLVHVRHTISSHRVNTSQHVQRLTRDLELSLNTRTQQNVV